MGHALIGIDSVLLNLWKLRVGYLLGLIFIFFIFMSSAQKFSIILECFGLSLDLCSSELSSLTVEGASAGLGGLSIG